MAGFRWLRRLRWLWKRRSPMKWLVVSSAAFVLLVKVHYSSEPVAETGFSNFIVNSPEEKTNTVQRPDGGQTTRSNVASASSYTGKNRSRVTRKTRRAKITKSKRDPYVSEQVSQEVQETLAILDEQLSANRANLTNFNWDTKNRRHFLIVTSWRTGSSFFGHVLAQYPAIFHVHEPLMYAGVRQIRNVAEDRPLATEAVRHLKDLLQCKYSREYTKHFYYDNGTLDYVTSHNVHITRACVKASNPYTCRDATYMQQACRRFPIFTAKIVRIRLRLLESLLADPAFPNLKIAYLIRDPRATMNSRFRIGNDSWCYDAPDCMEPENLCWDMIDDLDAFEMLNAKYPYRLILLRYEAMAEQPQNYFQLVYNFLGLDMPAFINETIKELTSESDAYAYGVIQRPEERLKAWRKELSSAQIEEINDKCADVINRLKYPI